MTEISSIRWEQDEDGIVVLTFDAPGKSANTYDAQFEADFAAAIDRLEAEREGIRGVILTSAKRSFFAGGDLHDLHAARAEDADRLFDGFTAGKARMRRLETLGVPVVAALNGAALGGGLEIALACHRRIVVDERHAQIGLPEVTFGLLPGGGGVIRTVRMLGAFGALDTLLLSGRALRPQEALDAGLVDEVVPSQAELLPAARRWILGDPEPSQVWDRDGYRMPGDAPGTPAFWSKIAPLVARVRSQSKGAPVAAPAAIAEVAIEGAGLDFETASLLETRQFVGLLIGAESKNRIQGSFLDMNAVRSGAGRPQGVDAFVASRIGVIGAGMMGAGIAYQAASRGIDVVLQDVTMDAAVRGRGYAERALGKRVATGAMTEEEAAAVLARITPSDDFDGLVGCDAVVEAVFEDPAIKKSTFAEVERRLPGILLASNTSTLPITMLADGLADPGMFIGMHFFSPVDRMPPVEVIVGEATGERAIAAAMDLSRQLGKLPIVVNDGRGFFTSRVIGKYLDEAVALLAEGLPAASVEQAAAQAGYPVGPLKLMDETTFSLPRSVRRQTKEAAIAEGRGWVDHPAAAVMDRMIDEFGRNGRSSGAGFYDYVDGARTGLWPDLAVHFGASPDAVPFGDAVDRLLFSEALESVRAFDDGVLRTAADANVGSMLAIGFPGWTGGVIQFIDGHPGGASGFVARAEELAARYGDRFAPPRSLVEAAQKGSYRASL